MIWLLAACAGPSDKAPAETATPAETAAPVVPLDGEWDVETATAWSGDCALEDPDNGYPAEAVWVVDVRATVVVVYLNYWVLVTCSLEEGALSCPLTDSSVETGRNWTVTVTRTLTGSFPDEQTFEGAFGLDLACEGEGCTSGAPQTLGEDLVFPCASSASVAGRWREALSEPAQ